MSSSKSLPLLAVGGLALAAGAAWLVFTLLSGPADGPEGADPAPARGPVQPDSGPASGERGAGLPAPGDPAGSEATAARSAAAVAAEEQPAGPLEPLEGHVVLPAGLPGDERVLVLALDQARTGGFLFDEGGPVERAWEGAGRDAEQGLLGVAEAASDGAFRIELPADLERVHLALAGCRLYTHGTTAVDLPEQDAVLAGELGGWVVGRLVAPKGYEGGLEGIEVKLGPDLDEGFDAFELANRYSARRAVSDPDGGFELRAVQTSLSQTVIVKPEGLALAFERGLRLEPGERRELGVELARGATLEGVARTEDGQPLAGVTVSARMRGMLGELLDDLRQVSTDAEGRFVLEAVPTGRIDLAGRIDGYRDARLRLDTELAEGERRGGLVIEFERGARIAGRVSFPGGEPAVGAAVRVSGEIGAMGAMSPDFDRTQTATVDEQGRFEVGGLAGSQYRVAAALAVESGERAGTWKARAEHIKPDGAELALVLDEPVTLRGRVVAAPGGEPVPTFQVFATLKGTGMMFGIGAERQRQPFEEREDGSFAFEGLREGSWSVVVEAEGYGRSEPQTVELPQAASAPPIEIRLPLAGVVSGRVVDAAGLPVPRASVRPELELAQRIEQAEGDGTPGAISDYEGRFRLEGLSPGSIELVADREGHAASAPETVEVLAGEVVDDIVLHLRRGGTLTGEVLDDDGDPKVGAMVVVQRVPSYSSQHILRTDAQGAFRIEHIEPGSWQVVVTPNLFSDELDTTGDSADAMSSFLDDLKLEMVDIEEGGTTHVVLGQPPEDPVQVRCKVVHAGEPIANALVSLVPDGVEGIGGIRLKMTDAEGVAQIQVDRPGPYHVTVQTGDLPTQQNSIEFFRDVPAGVESHTIDVELPGGRITGVVRTRGGDPLVGCRVTLHVDGGIRSESFYGGHYTEAATDAEGHYDIRYLDAGTYSVAAGGRPLLGGQAQAGRTIRSGITIGDGERLDGIDLQVEAPAKLQGVVRDVDGQPVPDAAVFLRDDQGRLLERFSMVTTGTSGRFEYEGLAPGTYTVSARVGQRASTDSAPVRVVADETATVEVTLESSTVLRVSIVDEDGSPVRGYLSVLDAEGREHAGMMSMTEVLEEYGQGLSLSERRVGPLPPGPYRIFARTEDGRDAEKPVRLSGKPERKVELRVR